MLHGIDSFTGPGTSMIVLFRGTPRFREADLDAARAGMGSDVSMRVAPSFVEQTLFVFAARRG